MMEVLGYKDGTCLEFAGPIGDPWSPLKRSIDGAVWAHTRLPRDPEGRDQRRLRPREMHRPDGARWFADMGGGGSRCCVLGTHERNFGDRWACNPRRPRKWVAGKNPAPATMNDEGLA